MSPHQGRISHEKGRTVVVKIDNEERFRIPIHNLEGIVCFGYMGASPQLMNLCSDQKLSVYHF